MVSFGKTIRTMRKKKGIGIKSLGPDLGVDHTYLSKIENDRAIPSPEVIDRMAHYFDCDRDGLYILANRLPPDVVEILRTRPREALSFIREHFADSGDAKTGP